MFNYYIIYGTSTGRKAGSTATVVAINLVGSFKDRLMIALGSPGQPRVNIMVQNKMYKR